MHDAPLSGRSSVRRESYGIVGRTVVKSGPERIASMKREQIHELLLWYPVHGSSIHPTVSAEIRKEDDGQKENFNALLFSVVRITYTH